MSITGLSESIKLYKKSFHRRNDSDELDVFEAARYFSGYNEAAGYTCNASGAGYAQRDVREDDWRGRRMSLDVTIRNPIPQQKSGEKQTTVMKEKKYKQPSSPGGRLASFLNSLFNQTGSKKKKSKSTTTTSQSMKDEDESPGGGRRKRRSSISHFRSTSTTTTDTTKPLYSSSSSGFRTPPPTIKSTTKLKPSDWKKDSILEEKLNKKLSWLDEKFRISTTTDVCPEKPKKTWTDEKQFRRFRQVDDDDGGDSDSSSDLFELQNYDLGIYPSSELPVYETTNIDSIKRGAPIN